MMLPGDMYIDPQLDRPSCSTTMQEQLALWPQAYGELLAFSGYLERRGSTITAKQILMACQMAEAEYQRLKLEQSHVPGDNPVPG